MNQLRLVVIVAVAIMLAGCVGTTRIYVTGEDVAPVGGFVDLKATGAGPQYMWAATGGRIVHQYQNRAIWEAPYETGTYTVQVQSGNASVMKRIRVVPSPVRVATWVLENDGIGGKNARVTILNLSDKAIVALRVSIAMWNHFGERVTHFGDYLFRGQASDTYIAPNDFRTFTWSLYWAGGVTGIAPWVTEVAFEDGSTWKLYQ